MVEHFLYDAHRMPRAAERLLALAERLVREAPDHARTPLGYVATDLPGPEGGAAIRETLFTLLLETARGDQDVLRLIDQLRGEEAVIGRPLDRLLAHRPDDALAFERRLIGIAHGERETARALAARVGPGLLYEPRGLMAEFAAAVGKGMSGEDAAYFVIQSRIG